MLLSIFSALYEAILSVSSDYSQEFRDNIFPSVGILTLVFAIVFAIIFYIALGRWKAIWFSRVHWSITLILLFLLSTAFALFNAKDILGLYSLFENSYVVSFSLFNGLFAVIYYIIFSFIFKRFSIFSKHTPI